MKPFPLFPRLRALVKEEDGWTFVETIIVIGIILVLSGSVGFVAVKYLDKAKVATAKSQVKSLALAVQTFALDGGRIPSTGEGLEALWRKPATAPESWNGPYLGEEVPADPWGRPYQYLVPGENGLPFGIRSLGADGSPGGSGDAADITSWKR